MSAGFGFAGVCASVEQVLVQQLQLQALPLPPELARLEGSWKGSAVALSARAYEGPQIGYARFVEITGGGLDIGNVLLLSRPDYPLPMLGADLVGLGKDTGVLVADLSPVPPRREPPLGEPERNQLNALGLPPGGDLPAWCQPWFSTQPVYSRVAPQHAPAVAAALRLLCERFVQLAEMCPPQPSSAPAVRDWQQSYCLAHRRDDRGLQLLHRMFDPTLAERFLRQVLFPEGVRT